jgi:uncharacterized repeat protein (TIGR01451 family)
MAVGTTAQLTISVANAGRTRRARNLVVSVGLPKGLEFVSSSTGRCRRAASGVVCSFGKLSARSTASEVLSLSVVAASGLHTVTVLAGSNSSDSEPSDNVVRLRVAIQAAPALADLTVSAVAAPGPVVLPNPVRYAITVTNRGPGEALRVLVHPRLSPGLASLVFYSFDSGCLYEDDPRGGPSRISSASSAPDAWRPTHHKRLRQPPGQTRRPLERSFPPSPSRH